MKIKLEWGKISVDGKDFHDVIILPSGRVFEREYEKIKEKYGTGHVIDEEEIKIVTETKPEILIIGKGFENAVKLTKKAYEEIEKNGIKLIELPTPLAIEKFLNLKNKKAAIFHSTC